MTLHYTDDHLTVHIGDCRQVLATLPAESVHCVVTSPPYWGLRDYGTATWLGGDEGCDHIAGRGGHLKDSVHSTRGGANKVEDAQAIPYRATCGKCGATRQDNQLGLEPTPEAYVANMVAVFREVRRVLRKDGTCWLNLGDSYNNRRVTRPSSHQGGLGFTNESIERSWADHTKNGTSSLSINGGPYSLKEKDLVGIPWRLAFALQADGWYLRSDIIWAKPNPMPESVTDRPTKSHEYVFLLAKGQWVTRVVQPADLDRQRIHLLDYLRSKGAPVGDAARLVSVLAQAVLEFSEGQDDLGLPPLDAQVWQQRSDGSDTDPVGRLPVEHRAAGWASRFLTANCSAEEFLRELNGLWVALPDRQQLLERWCASELSLTPSVDGDGEATVAIHDAGKVGKISLGRAHGLSISRPTGASYFYDADAVREPAEYGRSETVVRSNGRGWDHDALESKTVKPGDGAGGRNLRSVWQIATEPYPGAHFATFPQKLVEPCIKAGTSERGVCPECGAPWVREVERVPSTARTTGDGWQQGREQQIESGRRGRSRPGSFTRPYVPPSEVDRYGTGEAGVHRKVGGQYQKWLDANPPQTTGWRPSCAHGYCPDCYNTGDARTVGHLPRVRDHLRSEGPSPDGDLLLEGVREPSHGEDQEDDQGLRPVAEGLHPPLSSGASDVDADWLRGGASDGDGRDAGPDADAGRGGRPHQRDQGRQPTGEPSGDDEEGARRPVERGSGADGDMPRLRAPLPAQGSCGQCGADLEPLTPVPGVVLDCFAGSGTTGLVANRLGRRAILIDLSADYIDQAMLRNQQAPLGLGS